MPTYFPTLHAACPPACMTVCRNYPASAPPSSSSNFPAVHDTRHVTRDDCVTSREAAGPGDDIADNGSVPRFTEKIADSSALHCEEEPRTRRP